MLGGVGEPDPVGGVLEERSPGLHRFEDPPLPLGPEVIADLASLRHKADQGLGYEIDRFLILVIQSKGNELV